MKKFLLLPLIVLFTIQLPAQKAKDKNVGITYERWPLIGVDSTFKTYWATVKYIYKGAPGPTTSFNLKGTKNFTYNIGNPDLSIEALFYPPIILHSFVTADNTMGPSSPTSIPYIINVKDKQGNSIYSEIRNYFGETNSPTGIEINTASFFRLADESTYLKSLFFIWKYSHKMVITYGKGKYDYTDLTGALENCQKAADMYEKDQKQEAVALFKNCIHVWDNALNEKNLKDDQSRINKAIAAGLYVNIIQVLPFVDNFKRIDSVKESILNLITNINDRKNSDAKEAIDFAMDCKLRHDIKTGKDAPDIKSIETSSQLNPENITLKDYSGHNSEDFIDFLPGYWYTRYASYRFPETSTNNDLTKNIISEIKGIEEVMEIFPDSTLSFKSKTKKPEKMFWTVKKNKVDKKFVLIIDRSKDFDIRGTASLFSIEYIDKNLLVIKGDVYIKGDSTDPVYLIFERFTCPDNDMLYYFKNFK